MKEVLIYFNDETDKYLYADTVIYKGENLATKFIMSLPTELQGYHYKLALRLNDSTSVLTSELTCVDNTLEYVLPNTYTSNIGVLYIQLYCYNDDLLVMRSKICPFNIKESIIVV